MHDAAFQAIQYSGDEDRKVIVRGATLEHVTVARPNWMGVSATLVDDLTMRWVRITGNDPYDEFYRLPQSGALKTSRTRNVVVADSLIAAPTRRQHQDGQCCCDPSFRHGAPPRIGASVVVRSATNFHGRNSTSPWSVRESVASRCCFPD